MSSNSVSVVPFRHTATGLVKYRVTVAGNSRAIILSQPELSELIQRATEALHVSAT